jgi:hypothetical protein
MSDGQVAAQVRVLRRFVQRYSCPSRPDQMLLALLTTRSLSSLREYFEVSWPATGGRGAGQGLL